MKLKKNLRTTNTEDVESLELQRRSKSEPDLTFNPPTIPVLLIGYNRPELIIKRVEDLLRNNVENLFISIDGNEDLRDIMQETLKVVDSLCQDKCELNYKIHETNFGLAAHITNEISKLLEIYSEIIVLEDDIQIGENFLMNMERGLQHLNVSNITGIVSGFSPIIQPKYLKIANKWRKTPYFTCWGWLCTKDVWEKYILDISKINLNEALVNSKTWQAMNKWQQFLWLSRFRKIQQNPHHTWDIQFQFMCFRHEITNMAPMFSLTNNEGFNDLRSAHTKDEKPRWMNGTIIDSSTIKNTFSPTASFLFSKIIEPLTTSGDSRLIRFRNKIK